MWLVGHPRYTRFTPPIHLARLSTWLAVASPVVERRKDTLTHHVREEGAGSSLVLVALPDATVANVSRLAAKCTGSGALLGMKIQAAACHRRTLYRTTQRAHRCEGTPERARHAIRNHHHVHDSVASLRHSDTRSVCCCSSVHKWVLVGAACMH